MNHSRLLVFCWLLVGHVGVLSAQDRLPSPFAGKVSYEKDIAPLLSKHCASCHGDKTQESGLRVDKKVSLLEGGDSGEPSLQPGKSAESFLIQLVAGLDEDLKMPPEGPGLSKHEIAVLRTWVDSGMEWPGPSGAVKRTTSHWSFQPIVRPPIPRTHSNWVRNDIDRFILNRLREKGLHPSRAATPGELLRRVRLLDHGLPPTRAQMEKYSSARSYEALVEEILASPHLGERWAGHWLDLVRFGETSGYEVNRERPNAYYYRDYVIQAFNDDKPYDQFVMEQIAGDALGDGTGTGFLVAGPKDLVKSQDDNLTKMQRQDELADYINATGTTFLGLTLGCARCHNHKFDPITQKDFYALQAVFAGVQHGERALPAAPGQQERATFLAARIKTLETDLMKYLEVASEPLVTIDEVQRGGPGKRGFEELVPIRGRGQNPAGTQRGHKDDPGDSIRAPNLSGGSYSWWDNKPGVDLGRYHLVARGRYRIWLSWGSGPLSHVEDAHYLLDTDGDLKTRGDQVVLATVNQRNFSDGEAPTEQPPLWSGTYNAGIHEMDLLSTIILRGASKGAAITSDLVILESVPAGEIDQAADEKPTRPALRESVTGTFNRELFTQVQARFVRFTTLATNHSEPGLDELSIFAGDENVGLASRGAKATASSLLPGHAIHQVEHLNDGLFGNSNSWISNEPGRGWAQIELAKVEEINRVEWARDRNGRFSDRISVKYQVDVSIDGENWTQVSSHHNRIPFQVQKQPTYRFSGLEEPEQARARKKHAELLSSREELEQLGTQAMVYAGTFSAPEVIRRLYRGDFNTPREIVGPGAVEILGSLGLDQAAPEKERRVALARWIARRENPLTARVIVNRLWQFYFGTGIVDTPSDLGRAGTLPTHPELLDYLAWELMDNDWRLKHVHRLILHSATFRQSSRPHPSSIAVDADSRFLWRFPPRRLEAEAIRDSILFLSGALDTRMGGAGFPGFEVQAENVRHYFPLKEFGPQHWRRMIYMTKVRQEKDAVFGVFDCPDASQVVDKRSRSTTPLQALNLFNSTFVLQQCAILSTRMKTEHPGSVKDQVRFAITMAFGRHPKADEIQEAVAFVNENGLEQFCRAIMNSNEFVFVH